MGGLSFFLTTNFTIFLNFLLPLLDKIPSKVLHMQIEHMVALLCRTSRDRQRYHKGCRQVVGCVPYRYKKSDKSSSIGCAEGAEIEVLVISSQNGEGMLFPKGGWDDNESIEVAAERETLEEAGVIGTIEDKLGEWKYKSKRSGIMHEVYMFGMLVERQLECWPEKNIRERRWVTVDEARRVCHKAWMRDALEELVIVKQTSKSKRLKQPVRRLDGMLFANRDSR